MRRPLGIAVTAAILTWGGLVLAADDGQSKIGAFATAAEARARGIVQQGKTDDAGPAAPQTAATTAEPAARPDERQETAAADGAGTGEDPSSAAQPTTPSPTAAPAPGAQATASATPEIKQPAIPVSALVPAKQLFGSVKSAAKLQARAIGSYSRGCLAGAKALPVDGPRWQAMRLSRNRNWGHPVLVQTVERLAEEAWRYDGWNGLLVGDISQPRGGPMLTGHASHQIGLDADIWLTPMPERRLSNKEREDLSATSMIGPDDVTIDDKVWTPNHVKIIKRVASYGRVERVLVHPGIKKALCDAATAEGGDRTWLHKVRPYWGHNYHFHVRIGCPEGSAGCSAQAPTPGDDGCGKELADWIRRVTPAARSATPTPPAPAVPAKPPPPPVTLTELPQECRVVLSTGQPGIPKPLLDKQAKVDALIASHAKANAAKPAAGTTPRATGDTAAPAASASGAASGTATVPAAAALKAAQSPH